MTSHVIPAVFACAAVALAAPASAAPAGPQTATGAVMDLQAKGYHVVLNKVGAAPLDNCVVSGIRPGQLFERMDTGSGTPGSADDIVTTVTAMTVYVDVTC